MFINIHYTQQRLKAEPKKTQKEHRYLIHCQFWPRRRCKNKFWNIHLNNVTAHMNSCQRDALISKIYFWNRPLQVADRFSLHHQESSTVYTATGICQTGFADCLLAGSGWNSCSILIPLADSQHNLYDIYLLLCTVLDSWWWRENLSETCRFLFKK